MMEADSSNLPREVTPEQDPAPATERDEHQTRKRSRGSDSMLTEGASSGLHQLLDQLQVISSPVLQFTDKWREIHEEYAALQSSLKKQAVRLDLKDKSLMERVVELEKKEEMLKGVEERERKIGLLEKSLVEKEKENDVKQYLVSSLLRRLECETASEAANVLEEKEKEVERLSKWNDERSRELEKAVEEFEARERKLRLLDEAIKEKVSELEKKHETFDAEQILKAEEMELKRREMLAEVDKKEKSFEMELKAKADEMEVKEKQLEEREKELDLKQRELEKVMEKLKERELQERAETCKRSSLLAEKGTEAGSTSASSPQQRDKACEEETERIKIVDSEFHDFKSTMSSFSVDKIWALYDPQDEMPRLYAKIKRINKSRLSLDVTWLDPKEDESVPVACGRFTRGRGGTVSYLAFSHELKPIILGRNISVNPKEGETWALFKDLGQQHKPPYRYDLVEVVVGFKDHQGVGVAYLGKVEGFVSVFKHAAQGRVVKLVIRPDEMQRFSHRVPSVRLSGDEKEGVPAGSFELDPASVPSYILLGEKEPDVVQVNSAEDVPLIVF